jgi:hypothetical protein
MLGPATAGHDPTEATPGTPPARKRAATAQLLPQSMFVSQIQAGGHGL